MPDDSGKVPSRNRVPHQAHVNCIGRSTTTGIGIESVNLAISAAGLWTAAKIMASCKGVRV